MIRQVASGSLCRLWTRYSSKGQSLLIPSSSSFSSCQRKQAFSSSQMSESNFLYEPCQRLKQFVGGTVWEEFSPLAVKYNAVNLGQGFPNFSGPSWVLEAAKEAIDKDMNQYTRPAGFIPLVQSVAKLYSPLFGREIDPLTEVLTTNGSSEGLYSAIMGLADPGDEVVMFEPFFDIYNGAIAMAQAVPKYVPLRAPENIKSASEFTFSREDLEAAITDKTRIIMLNTPHNPTGKVFSKEELQIIADVVAKHPRAIVVADEVYEWLTFDGVEHVRFATLPGMWERTLTACSAGKTFSITGWKTGWVIGPKPLVSAALLAHSYIPFCIATPFQYAVSQALEKAPEENYFEEFRAMYQRRRDRLVETLRDVGLTPIVPQGTFFVLADFSKLKIPEGIGREVTVTGLCPDRKDWNACRYMVSEVGVAAIPPSAFYCEEHQKFVGSFIRLAFCKTDEEIELACEKLQKLKDL